MKADDQLENALAQAMLNGNGDSLGKYAYNLETDLLEMEYFPEPVFRELLTVLQRKSFQELQGSWQLIKVFEDNWDLLSEEQRDKLLGILEMAYEYFADWMSCFMIAEILGRLFMDRRALEVLARLKNVINEVPRSLIPHGLERLVANCPQEDLTRKALQQLMNMRTDPSEKVRTEVREALARLTKRGKI